MRIREYGKKIIGIILIGITVIIVLAILTHKNNNQPVKYTIVNNKYDATKAIKVAKDRLKNEKEAKIITDVPTMDKVIAITFKGLSNMETNRKVLNVMEEHKAKGSFYIPGILAAENTKIVEEIYSKGNRIESNSLSGQKQMESFSQNKIITDLCSANNIIQTISGRIPTSLLLNETKLTPEVLKAAYASGNESIMKGTHYINYQSFSSYAQVLDYVKRLDYGTIITIKMDGVLDKGEYKTNTNQAKPAKDKKGTITASSEFTSKTEEERLVMIITWLLQAVDETGYKTVFTDDLPRYRDSDFSRNFNELRKKNNGRLAEVHTKIYTNKNLISFTFRGLEIEKKLDEILDFLQKTKKRATFFVTGEDIVSYPDRIQKILDSGNTIANGGLTGKDLTSMNFNEICLEIYKCDKLLKERYHVNTDIFMPVYGKYNDLVREAVSTLHYSCVTYNKNSIINDKQTPAEIMNYYKNGIQDGDIIYFRLDYYKNLLDVVKQTYQKAEKSSLSSTFVKTLLDNETVYVKHNSKPNSAENKHTGDTSASDNLSLRKQILELRSLNHGTEAAQLHTIYTTERALSFAFSGIKRTDVLNDVLDKMDSLGAKGTFFVTENDMKNHAYEIKKIASKGHEIGICLTTSSGTDFNSVCRSILMIQREVKKLTGQKPILVRYAYEIAMTKQMLEAVSSTGCMVVWQDVSIAASKLGENATLPEVLHYVFNEGNIEVHRGYIIYFRMEYYKDASLIGNTLLRIAKDRIDTIKYNDINEGSGSAVMNDTMYSIKSISKIKNSNLVYHYPVDNKNILPSVKDVIHSGYLEGLSDADKFEYMRKKYIGNPSINTLKTLPGFTNQELLLMDKSGRFTNDKVLFLTFDDWGSDKTISQILYILKKYDVKATFFARTNYVLSNPNLLRAIAVEGHDVGSHTDEHLPFAITDKIQSEEDADAVYTSPSVDEITKRKEDLHISYNKMQSIIGDVQINGVPALTTLFRPPTLAMSKIGMEAILDMGFSYIVSGDFSTHDYAETDPQVLANKIMNGIALNNGRVRTIQNGSILVMHMSDDSKDPTNVNDVTAQALDIVIPQLIAQGYHFAKLSNYLSENKVIANDIASN